MKKNQKSFNALECGLCPHSDCFYRQCYESMYHVGKKIPVAQCKRLQEQKRKEVWGL